AKLSPDLAGTMAPPVLCENTPDLGSRGLFTEDAARQTRRTGPSRQAIMAGGRGDRQRLGRLHPLGHVAGNASAPAAVDLGVLDPVVQPVRRAADLRRNRRDRLPASAMSPFTVENHPRGALFLTGQTNSNYPLVLVVLIALAVLGSVRYYAVVALEKTFAGWADIGH
ncbi:hypothetical protein C357_21047, partial [Citreicella sp. 357]